MAACVDELAPFVELKQRYLEVRSDGIAFLSAGVGPTAASFGLAHFLEDYRPERVIGIGTAGIINSGAYRIGDIVCASSVSVASHDASVYALSNMPDIALSAPVGFTHARVFCPQEITCSLARKKILQAHHDVENLEAYSYAFVAGRFKIPIKILLGLTNEAGPDAHAQWRANSGYVCDKLKTILMTEVPELHA